MTVLRLAGSLCQPELLSVICDEDVPVPERGDATAVHAVCTKAQVTRITYFAQCFGLESKLQDGNGTSVTVFVQHSTSLLTRFSNPSHLDLLCHAAREIMGYFCLLYTSDAADE